MSQPRVGKSSRILGNSKKGVPMAGSWWLRAQRAEGQIPRVPLVKWAHGLSAHGTKCRNHPHKALLTKNPVAFGDRY